MVMLQKFKLMATQCGAPAPSPTSSPLIQLRRRKTLRTLLGRTPRRRDFSDRQTAEKKKNKKSKDSSSRTLKDLFVSSPPLDEDTKKAAENLKNKSEAFPSAMNGEDISGDGLGAAPLSPRPVWLGFRHRFIKRAWRPVLVTIPE
ncbi:hypothetical protein AAG906_031776 [Vitis piasezkii]